MSSPTSLTKRPLRESVPETPEAEMPFFFRRRARRPVESDFPSVLDGAEGRETSPGKSSPAKRPRQRSEKARLTVAPSASVKDEDQKGDEHEDCNPGVITVKLPKASRCLVGLRIYEEIEDDPIKTPNPLRKDGESVGKGTIESRWLSLRKIRGRIAEKETEERGKTYEGTGKDKEYTEKVYAPKARCNSKQSRADGGKKSTAQLHAKQHNQVILSEAENEAKKTGMVEESTPRMAMRRINRGEGQHGLTAATKEIADDFVNPYYQSVLKTSNQQHFRNIIGPTAAECLVEPVKGESSKAGQSLAANHLERRVHLEEKASQRVSTESTWAVRAEKLNRDNKIGSASTLGGDDVKLVDAGKAVFRGRIDRGQGTDQAKPGQLMGSSNLGDKGHEASENAHEARAKSFSPESLNVARGSTGDIFSACDPLTIVTIDNWEQTQQQPLGSRLAHSSQIDNGSSSAVQRWRSHADKRDTRQLSDAVVSGSKAPSVPPKDNDDHLTEDTPKRFSQQTVESPSIAKKLFESTTTPPRSLQSRTSVRKSTEYTQEEAQTSRADAGIEESVELPPILSSTPAGSEGCLGTENVSTNRDHGLRIPETGCTPSSPSMSFHKATWIRQPSKTPQGMSFNLEDEDPALALIRKSGLLYVPNQHSKLRSTADNQHKDEQQNSPKPKYDSSSWASGSSASTIPPSRISSAELLESSDDSIRLKTEEDSENSHTMLQYPTMQYEAPDVRFGQIDSASESGE